MDATEQNSLELESNDVNIANRLCQYLFPTLPVYTF